MPGHPFADRWNHNSHYYPLIASLIPAEARTVADVGAGDGTLARHLVRPGRTVLAVEPDAAARPGPEPGLVPVAARAEALPLGDAGVDALTLVMVLHQVDPPAALAEVRRVVRSGGVVVVVGYGRAATAGDLLWEVRDVVEHRWHARGTTRWEPDVALADPVLTWAQTRALLRRELPGGTYRRLPMWRYLYSWTA